jgi:hypothetical protein
MSCDKSKKVQKKFESEDEKSDSREAQSSRKRASEELDLNRNLEKKFKEEKIPSISKQTLNNNVMYLYEPKDVFKHQFLAVRSSISAKKFVPHECSPACLPTVLPKVNDLNPLAKPLLCFWERQIAKRNESDESFVHYKAPCGRRLRHQRTS